mgnify:CR=1 FL=1
MPRQLRARRGDGARTDGKPGRGKRRLSGSAWKSAGLLGSQAITAELRRAILGGDFADGERLPPERDLAGVFGASRTTVRRALKRLEDFGLVVRRVGSGTFINHQPSVHEGDIADVISPLKLVEVRLAVEPQMTRLAALNASARDLGHLGEALGAVEAAGESAKTFTKRDEEFHSRLALCTQNPLLVSIYNRINEVRGHAQWIAMRDKILTSEAIGEYNAQHRALYQALCSRDVDLAVTIAVEHLEKARRDLLGAGLAERRHSGRT